MRIIKIILKVVVMLAIFTFATMVLWNNLIPEIFKGPTITYAQALGLLILSRVIFGGFGHGFARRGWGHHYWNKKKFEEKLSKLSPEEQEKFRTRFETKCC